MGTPYPGLVKPEVHFLSWLPAASTLLREWSFCFSLRHWGEELSLCKVGGQRGEPLNCCDIRNKCLGVQRGSTSCQEGQGYKGFWEHAQLS